jgi:hypothetical protein
VLVVADERPLGIRGQGRFPRARQAEQKGDVAGFSGRSPSSASGTPRCGSRKLSTVKIDFLISPAYFVPPINTIFFEIQHDERFRAGAVPVLVREKRRGVEDVELGLVRRHRFRSGDGQEEIAGEQRVPGFR